MLTSLGVESWKSIQTATLNIDPLTVLIGANSSGKSNLLDALSFLSRIANGVLLTSALQGDGALAQLRGGLEWAPRHPGAEFTIRATIRVQESQDLDYEITCRIEKTQCEILSERLDRWRYRLDKHEKRGVLRSKVSLFWTDPIGSDTPTVTARVYNSKGGSPRHMSRSTSVLFQLYGQKTLSETQEGVEATLQVLRNIFILDPIPSHMRGFSLLSDRLAVDSGNIAGVLAALPAATKTDVERTLTALTIHQFLCRPERGQWAEGLHELGDAPQPAGEPRYLGPRHLGGLTLQNFFSAGVGWWASSQCPVETAL